MKNKNIVVMVVLTTLLVSSAFFSIAAARETVDESEGNVDGGLIAPAPDEPNLIAPGPEDNSTSTDDEQTYYILDQENATDDSAMTGEEGNLIATNTGTDNNVIYALIGVALVAICAGAIGVFHYHRRKTAK